MKEENKSGTLLSPTGKKLVEAGKRWLTTRPAGGHIPIKEYGEWETYKKGCVQAGVSVSHDGFLDMLKTHNKINKIMFPIAESYGYNQIKFKNDMIDVLLRTVREIDNEDLIEKTAKLHKDIFTKTEENIIVQIKDKIRPC